MALNSENLAADLAADALCIINIGDMWRVFSWHIIKDGYRLRHIVSYSNMLLKIGTDYDRLFWMTTFCCTFRFATFFRRDTKI